MLTDDSSGSDKTGAVAADGAQSDLGADGLSEKFGKSSAGMLSMMQWINKGQYLWFCMFYSLYYKSNVLFYFFTTFTQLNSVVLLSSVFRCLDVFFLQAAIGSL